MILKFLRKMRLVGLVIFFGNTFVLFTFSLFHSFNLFSLLNISGVKDLAFSILALVMATGFLLMFIGGVLQRKFQGTEEEKDVEKLGIDKELYEKQKEYGAPKEVKGRDAYIFLWITLIFFALTAVFYLLDNVLPWSPWSYLLYNFNRGFYHYSVAFGAVAVAILVSFIVGNINEDVMRFYIGPYHLHESVIGIYFAMIGGPLLSYWFYSLEFCIGLAFLVSGIFLVGRDWEDVVKGEMLVHKSREADYEKYKKMKEHQEELQSG
ncbi:MAG: hypothetical protein ACFFCS_07520 [Candidatus Hodarchaeota archaeon]